MAGFTPALLAPPDEQTQDAATVANVIDPAALAALPPPPPVDAGPTVPQLATLAAQPPAFARPDTPVDAALATALPPADSVVPVPPPPADPATAAPGTGAAATPVEAAKKNVADLAALDAEQQGISAEKTKLETDLATEKDEFTRAREVALTKLQERQEFHRTEAANAVAEARAKAETQPYHTFWESRSVGQNVATALGLILGGVSWNPNHVNRGVQLLENMMAQDLALQKEQHADLWRAVEAAERGERALDHRELRETAAFSAAQGAKWDAVAGRLGAMIAANKGKGDTATAKRVMIEANEKAVTAWQNAESAAAAAAHLKELEAEARERNRIMEIRANKYKTKGGAAGSGGGRGSSLEQAAVILQEKIEAAKTAGKPLSVSEIDKLASQGIEVPGAGKVKIPLIGKPNTINARQIIADTAKFEPKKQNQVGIRGSEKRLEFDGAISALDTLIAQIEKNPKAWDAYRENQKKWEERAPLREGKIGAIGKMAGFVNIKPEQGLEGNSEALTLFQRQSKLDTAIAKSFGGVITEGDRSAASSNQANFALTAKEKVQQLREYRDEKKRAYRTLTGEEWQPGGGKPAAAGGTSAGLPAGAIPGTQKSTGRRGYMLNGKFTPLDGDIVL